MSELKNFLQEDTKMSLTYIAEHICCKDEKIDDTFFCYEKYGSFLKTIDLRRLKVSGHMVC